MLSTPICITRVTMETNGIGREKEEHQGKRGSVPPDTVLVDEKIRMEEKADSKDVLLPLAEGNKLYECEPVYFVVTGMSLQVNVDLSPQSS